MRTRPLGRQPCLAVSVSGTWHLRGGLGWDCQNGNSETINRDKVSSWCGGAGFPEPLLDWHSRGGSLPCFGQSVCSLALGSNRVRPRAALGKAGEKQGEVTMAKQEMARGSGPSRAEGKGF